MKTVVLSHTATATVFNPKFLEYARARGGFAVRACNVRKGNEKGRVERPIGFVRRRFWPGRRFRDLLDLNAQAAAWRDDFANDRVHEVTGKVPSLVFEHEEKRLLKPIPDTPFDTDDVEGTRRHQDVPRPLRSQSLLRAVAARLASRCSCAPTTTSSRVFLGPKQVAQHRRSWDVGEDIEHPSHKQGSARAEAARRRRRAAAGARRARRRPAAPTSSCSPPARAPFIARPCASSSSSSSSARPPPRAPIAEVMRTGHVGAEYVEYVLRHKRGLVPAPRPLRLGNPELDAISLPEPDLSVYDQLVRRR